MSAPHVLDCEDPSRQQSSRTRFDPAAIYGPNFIFNDADYDFPIVEENPYPPNFVYLPCPQAGPCFCCGKRAQHADAIVVAIAGAVRDHGSEGVQGGCGYYFSNDPQLYVDLNNWHASTLQPPQTLEKAELMACLSALERIEREHNCIEIPHTGMTCQLTKLVIKTHSAYLFNALTEYLSHWKESNYQDVPTANAQGFQEIDAQLTKLESFGIRVLFWLVRKSQNAEAEYQANFAIDQAEDDPEPTEPWW